MLPESQDCMDIAAHETNPKQKLFQIAVIKTFEMTFELAWKTLKDYLNFQGIMVSLPREVIKQGFASGLIEDGQLWIDMLDERNLMAHTYGEINALKATDQICQHYLIGLTQLYQTLLQRMT